MHTPREATWDERGWRLLVYRAEGRRNGPPFRASQRPRGQLWKEEVTTIKKKSFLFSCHCPSPPSSHAAQPVPFDKAEKSKKWAQSCGPQRPLSQRRGGVRAHAPGSHRCRQVASYFLFPPSLPLHAGLSPGTLSTITSRCRARGGKNFSRIAWQSQHTCTLRMEGGRVNFKKMVFNLTVISFRGEQVATIESNKRGRTQSILTSHSFKWHSSAGQYFNLYSGIIQVQFVKCSLIVVKRPTGCQSSKDKSACWVNESSKFW